ncbi:MULTISPECIES: urease accessory protein UreD [Streptomyces]|uniref:Urease accessory protein UreD 3 n=1 Tax=Streptomyces griseus subsp. griseus (strain JCM 4626 / CBS 651.72 / NBRC 13350 / KCC S-0626 / ISP 5235) TaxID=455632 RepID=URED3_STRGG|nr:urease accessory protein UreD [Streptomyces griseus]B1W5H2.1 RecName: Full=Urease accessory protein UreD 3 [Streptomyces griseus subsp. griseus NBRC 13350]BAG23129.1 putative urease accessory protein [Streptomyces griseus subsp. griseus NBRC 13350]SEE40391.1 urease accessory protein [Streptomyces griseus]SQA20720.1 urease accessory protein [Streptomyces griseus]
MSVRATARLRAEPDGRDGTALPVLAGEGPLALRRTRSPQAAYARVTVVGAMSAPLNGDRLAVEAEVTDGAHLTVDAAAATVALPGPRPDADPSTYGVDLTVGEGAVLHWLPEQLVSAHGSDLRMTTRVRLAPTARLLLREEQILGRHGEPTGALTTRLTVHHAGRPLLDQQLAYGPGAPGGWDGPAVLAGHRAVGQLLLADPSFGDAPLPARLLGPTAALTPLAGPAVLVTAVAADARLLRGMLDEAMRELLDTLKA